MKLAHIDSKDIQFEKVSNDEKAIIEDPHYTVNSFGRESTGHVTGFAVSGSGDFDLKFQPPTPQHEGVGRYCSDGKYELNYNALIARGLVNAMQTEGETPLRSAGSLRAFCEDHPEFKTGDNTYAFKVTDDNLDKTGYFDKESGNFGYEGGVSFFRVELKQDSSEVSLKMDTFVSDLFNPYLEQTNKGIPLYDRSGEEQCRIKNGSEIQISGEHGTKQYSCYLYDTRSLYDIDNGIQPDMLILFDEKLDELNKGDIDIQYEGNPCSCERILPDIDRNNNSIGIRQSSFMPEQQADKGLVTVQVSKNIVSVKTGRNSGKEFLSVRVPNDDLNDKRYQRTFLVFKEDKNGNRLYRNCADGKHVNIKLDPGKKIKLTRSEKTADGWNQEESWCSVDELKEKLSRKPNLQKKVSRYAETAKQASRREPASARRTVNQEH